MITILTVTQEGVWRGAFAEEQPFFESPISEEELPFSSVVTEIPRTSLITLKKSFRRETLLPWTGILLSTGLLYHYDQDILDGVQRKGREMGIGNQDHTRTFLRVGPYPILRLPTDAGSAMYFLGDGWIHMGTAAGFLLTGYVRERTGPWNVGVQLVHGMIVSTLFSQAIKRATGRESPTHQTEERGAWRPFPSIQSYNQHTPRYDAFPSGHIMTATLTFTVIGENYPQYKNWIWPVEITWLTLLGLQMVNNGVHWASDYPLGIAMGYQIGKISAQMRNPSDHSDSMKDLKNNYLLFASQWADTPTLNVLVNY